MINVFKYEMYKSFDAVVVAAGGAAAAMAYYVNRKCKKATGEIYGSLFEDR